MSDNDTRYTDDGLRGALRCEARGEARGTGHCDCQSGDIL
jgi:hypothetical protein